MAVRGEIARHNAGCSLMREPSRRSVIAAMTKRVKFQSGEDRRGMERATIHAPEWTAREGPRIRGRLHGRRLESYRTIRLGLSIAWRVGED